MTITAYFGVFKEKLHKTNKRLKAELEKEKRLRDKKLIKQTVKELRSLKKSIKEAEAEMEEMEEQRTTLFVKKEFRMHSGGIAHYKIECDALTDDDIETLAFMIATRAKKLSKKGTGINRVHGVPEGGLRLAKALEQYGGDPKGTDIIVDDVLTTGASMEGAKKKTGWTNVIGVVIFARGHYPSWIKPIFEMHWINTEDEKP